MPRPAASSTYTRYETRRRDPNPRAAALLVIDVQGHFAPLTAPAMPAIATTVALCRGAGIPVIYTRHVDPVPRSRPLAEWWAGDHIGAGTPGAELLPGAGRAAGDLVVEKSTYSAFAAGTGLDAGGDAARDGRGGGGRGGRDDQPVLRDHRAGRVRQGLLGLLLGRRYGHGQPGPARGDAAEHGVWVRLHRRLRAAGGGIREGQVKCDQNGKLCSFSAIYVLHASYRTELSVTLPMFSTL